MTKSIWEEKKTKKYKDAVELAVSLEKTDVWGKSPDDIRQMEPKRLYGYLEDEWWRRWNGLLQEWENPE